MTRQEAQHRITEKRLAMDVIDASLNTVNHDVLSPLNLLHTMMSGEANPTDIKRYASTQLACWTLREDLTLAFQHMREFYDAQDDADRQHAHGANATPATEGDVPPA